MTNKGVQDSSVERNNEPILHLAPTESEALNLSFAEHHEALDRFVEDCRNWLRNSTAYHGCEAQVVATWNGRPVLVRHEMTNATLPNGAPLVISVNCELPVPWMSEKPLDHADAMRQGLIACDQAIEQNKVQYKCLRVSFAAYARSMSLTLAKPPVKENGRQTAIALP